MTLHDSGGVTVKATFAHFDGWLFVCAYTPPEERSAPQT